MSTSLLSMDFAYKRFKNPNVMSGLKIKNQWSYIFATSLEKLGANAQSLVTELKLTSNKYFD